MKEVVAAFKQEKALVGAFSVITRHQCRGEDCDVWCNAGISDYHRKQRIVLAQQHVSQGVSNINRQENTFHLVLLSSISAFITSQFIMYVFNVKHF